MNAADIAAVIVAALLDPVHASQAYEVTGPEALTHDDIADRFTAVGAHRVQHVRIDDAYRAALTEVGTPGWAADAAVEMFTRGARGGHCAVVTDHIEQVTGHPPRPVDAWIADNADLLAADPGPDLLDKALADQRSPGPDSGGARPYPGGGYQLAIRRSLALWAV